MVLELRHTQDGQTTIGVRERTVEHEPICISESESDSDTPTRPDSDNVGHSTSSTDVLPTPPPSNEKAVDLPSSPILEPSSDPCPFNDESDAEYDRIISQTQTKRRNSNENPRRAKRRTSPWHGKDTTASEPPYEYHRNPADSVPVVGNICRHEETKVYVCGECKVAVLKGQWRNHFTRKHRGMDKEVRNLLDTYEVDELPTNIDTPLPLIEVVKRRYCFHCRGVFKNQRDHPPHDECFTGTKVSVWCQFYHQNKGVIIGPNPEQPTQPQLRRMARNFLPPLETHVPQVRMSSDQRETATIAREFHWIGIHGGKTKSEVGHLVELIDEESDYYGEAVERRLMRSVDWILDCAQFAIVNRGSLFHIVGGIRNFHACKNDDTFNDHKRFFKRAILYTYRTHNNPEYEYDGELKTKFDKMVETLKEDVVKPYPSQQYHERKLHHMDEVDEVVLDALYALVRQRHGNRFTSHPWICAVAVWALNDRGGFRVDTTYPPFFVALKKMSRYIYIEMAWVKDKKDPQSFIVKAEKERTINGDVITTMCKLEYIRQQNTARLRGGGEIRWYMEDNQVVFRDKAMGFPEFGAVAKRITKDLKDAISELFGVKYDDIPTFDLFATSDDSFNDVGESLITPFLEQDAEDAVLFLLKGGKLRSKIVTENGVRQEVLYWEAGEQKLFFSRMHNILRLLTMVMYLTLTGVARAPEFQALTWRTSHRGTHCRCSFFRYKGMVLVHFFNQKSKRFKNKGIMRFLPEEVSYILFKIFRFAFPIYRFTPDDMGYQPNSHDYLVFPQNRTWVPSCLKEMWSRYFGIEDASLQNFRHIMSALFCMLKLNVAEFADVGDDIDNEDYDGDNDPLAADVDLLTLFRDQFGHTGQTANEFYGAGAYTISTLSEIEIAVRHKTCVKIQRLMGFAPPEKQYSTAGAIRLGELEQANAVMNADYDKLFSEHFPAYRNTQKLLIEATTKKSTTRSIVLGIVPTGGGKTASFCIPASWISANVTIVLVPTVALEISMVDDINRTYTHVNAYRYRDFQGSVPALGARTILVMTYESFHGATNKLKKLTVSRLVVDEAHYIQQTSADFRPTVKSALQSVFKWDCPILLLSGTVEVGKEKDLMREYGVTDMEQVEVVRAPIQFPNVKFVFEKLVGTWEDAVRRFLRTHSGKVLVFVKRVDVCQQLYNIFKDNPAENYPECEMWHNQAMGESKLRRFRGDLDLMFCTNGLSLGVDLPVSGVLVLDTPLSTAEFCQMAGRAGRRGTPAVVTLVAKQQRGEGFFGRFTSGRECLTQVYRTTFDSPDAGKCQGHDQVCSVCGNANTVPQPQGPTRAEQAIQQQTARVLHHRDRDTKMYKYINDRFMDVRRLFKDSCIYCTLVKKPNHHCISECPLEAQWMRDEHNRRVEWVDHTTMLLKSGERDSVCGCGLSKVRCHFRHCPIGDGILRCYYAMSTFYRENTLPMERLLRMPVTKCLQYEQCTLFVVRVIEYLCRYKNLNFYGEYFDGYDKMTDPNAWFPRLHL
ncbi:hypothetical protein DIRU0_D34618 [Diutina rugosa]